MNPTFKKTLNIIIYIFAGIGLVMVLGYMAVQFGWTNTKGIVDSQHDYFKNQTASSTGADEGGVWTEGQEWLTLSEAIKKDVDVINKVSAETGVPSRLLVSPLVVEQLRLFYSEREVFKQIFAPLKILGNQSQFSWGVMGIKQDTARQIETNLKDSKSPWYLGSKYEHVLDYPGTSTNSVGQMDASGSNEIGSGDTDAMRFERLTNEKDRYYSYLYAAYYIKELEKQWSNAGFPIEKNPGVVATLYNIGFQNSKPHADPLTGGAEIDVGTTTYSFGSLAQSFYDSNELTTEFPR